MRILKPVSTLSTSAWPVLILAGPYLCQSDDFDDGPPVPNQGPLMDAGRSSFYDVERIIGHRMVRRGSEFIYTYEVKWDETTWEPRDNVAGMPAYYEYWESMGPC
ncbi:uncharacterized protein B0H18DRAFT_345452 [Fomitopsis serialis]|uniref:uncharacterized protein n=1 Tax=Fomitopsis serialis TaxID=139415 RepID=UPI002007D46A|nr:uncharacterized protein B0H18DRAFT_345452 [Neoantrodia serialis]KAH9926513.1 hypothetical protein B0H18DRAFT_345452 [Neoantrodia serialis]